MTKTFTCGEIVMLNPAEGNDLAGTFAFVVEPYVEYFFVYGASDNSTRRWVVRANGECGTRLLDTGFVGKVPPLAACGGVQTAPCCVKNAQTDDVCTGVLQEACPGRYVHLS